MKEVTAMDIFNEVMQEEQVIDQFETEVRIRKFAKKIREVTH